MKGYIYAIVAGVLLVSLVGNKVLYDARARAQAEVKTLTAEVKLREKEAEINAEIGVKHAKELEDTRKQFASAQRKLDKVLAETSAWTNTRVPVTVVDSLRDAICKTDSSNAACKPAARTHTTDAATGSDKRGSGEVRCRTIGSYLNGESGQTLVARIF